MNTDDQQAIIAVLRREASRVMSRIQPDEDEGVREALVASSARYDDLADVVADAPRSMRDDIIEAECALAFEVLAEAAARYVRLLESAGIYAGEAIDAALDDLRETLEGDR